MRFLGPISKLAVLTGTLALSGSELGAYEGPMSRMVSNAINATRITVPDASSLRSDLSFPPCSSTDAWMSIQAPVVGIPPVNKLDRAPPPVSTCDLSSEDIRASTLRGFAAFCQAPSATPLARLRISNLVPPGPFKAIPSPALNLTAPLVNRRLPQLRPMGAPALPNSFSAFAAARLVRNGLLEGTLNPRNPQWRPHLALLLEDKANAASADFLFDTLLAGCAGLDERARVAAAEAWADSYENGRFAETIAYGAARHAFASDDMAATVSRCGRLIEKFPRIADRGMLLLALVQAQTDERAKALVTLRELRERHPNSPSAPEARFMEAWIALEESRKEDAIAILSEIVDKTPRAPAAIKANQMLASLKGAK